jgi:hypothetical protein
LPLIATSYALVNRCDALNSHLQLDTYLGLTSLIELVSTIDPNSVDRVREWLKICADIHTGFVAQALSEVLPSTLRWIVEVRHP